MRRPGPSVAGRGTDPAAGAGLAPQRLRRCSWVAPCALLTLASASTSKTAPPRSCRTGGGWQQQQQQQPRKKGGLHLSIIFVAADNDEAALYKVSRGVPRYAVLH